MSRHQTRHPIGKCLIDYWNVHGPAVDEPGVPLDVHHTIRIEHFDASGFATLDFRMRPIR